MKPKVIILSNRIMHYRVPVFNLICEKYDLTVAYDEGELPDVKMQFKTIKLTKRPILKFTSHKENIFELCKNYDAVVALNTFAYLKYTLLSFRKNRPFGLAYWGIGAAASYHRKYGEAGKLYYMITTMAPKRADAIICYAESGRQIQIKHGLNPDKVFVANNTVEVPRVDLNTVRSSIMFIGTLYPQKGLDILLNAYKRAYQINKNVLPLDIVGDGPLSDEIHHWIKDNNLSYKIILHGALYKSADKAKVFSKAYACISPNQGGLGVLESMAYGVPFITSKNAITGGEAFNIKDGVNGRRLECLDNLHDVILDITSNPQTYESMGRNAYHYYWTNRTPQHMANGLIQAIHYTLEKGKFR